MPPLYPVKNSFAAGEVSPRIGARTDTTFFKNGAEELVNFITLPQGGITRRGAFRCLTACHAQVGQKVVLIPWIFNEAIGQQYLLECGYYNNGSGTAYPYIRVHYGASGTVPYGYAGVQLSTADGVPWALADIPNIRVAQKNDVMYLVDGTHVPQKLIRSGATQPGTWTLHASGAPLINTPFELENRRRYRLRKIHTDVWQAYQNKTTTDFNALFTQDVVKSGYHEDDVWACSWGDDGAGGGVSEVPNYLLEVDGFPFVEYYIWTWEMESKIYIPVAGTWRFGLNAGQKGDLFIDGKYICGQYTLQQPQNDGYQEFTLSAVHPDGALSAGLHHMQVRMMTHSAGFGGYGVAVAWRNDDDAFVSGEADFTGSGTDDLTWTEKWKGDPVYEVVVKITNGATNEWGWGWRALVDYPDAEDPEPAWSWDPETGEGFVTGAAVAYGLNNSGKNFADITMPGTGHQTGDEWRFKVGFAKIPASAVKRTEDLTAASYPRCVALFEESLLFAGSPARPNAFWKSKTGDYENFTFGDADDDAFEAEIGGQRNDAIYWMLSSMRRLLLGSASAEYIVGQNDQPLTPSTCGAYATSHNGSKYCNPVVTETGAVIYVEKSGKRLREFQYHYETDSYRPRDVSITSDHLTADGIKQLAYQQGGVVSPDSGPVNIIWAVTETGNLVGLTYEPDHEVYAWHRHKYKDLTGNIIAIATLPTASGGDDLFVIVQDGVNYWITRLVSTSILDGGTGLDGSGVTFESSIIPLPVQVEESIAVHTMSWASLILYLLGAENDATNGLRIAREKAAAWANMEVVPFTDVGSTAPAAVRVYVPGWDTTGQFRLATKNKCTLLGIQGALDVHQS